jgi:Putative zinc-finger
LRTDVENSTFLVCPYEGELEIRSLYLAGKLPDKDAEAFEAHYFVCERCAEAVEVGGKLRMAFENLPVHADPASTRAARTWLPLAAAAAIALVAAGIWTARRPAELPDRPVLRGGLAGGFAVRVETRPNGATEASWLPPPGATAYVVRVVRPDGLEIWKTETRDPHAAIPLSELTSAGPVEKLLVEVEALDARGRVISSSEPARMQ